MTKRKQNPVHHSRKKFRYNVEDGVRKPLKKARDTMTKRERREFIKTTEYMERIEKLREHRIFGDTFDAKNGFNLRKMDDVTPAQKRKITRYYRVMANKLSGAPVQIFRPRRKDHLESAIDASLQEERLPGQKAAIFVIPDAKQKVQVRFRRDGTAVTKRGRLTEQSLLFDKNEFINDWKGELDRVLENVPDAKVFKFIAGGNKSSDTFTRADLVARIAQLIETYTEEREEATGFVDRFFGEWLNGVIAYEGVTMRSMKSQDRVRKGEAAKRRREAAKERAKTRRMFKTPELQRGRALTKGEKLTGRKGRVK